MRQLTICLLLLTCVPPALVSEEVLDPIDELAQRVRAEVTRAEDGTVIGFRKRQKDDFGPADVAVLAQYPDLTYLMLNNPVINLPELQEIGTWTQLEHLVLWLGGGAPDISSEFVLHLGALQNLRTLDMKHTFAVKGEPHIQDMATFPRLEKLVVDTVHSNAELVPFVERHPGIRWLRIHRTAMSDEDFCAVVAALPELTILELKPADQREGIVGPAGLAHLAGAEHLRYLTLSHEWDEATWDAGIRHLVDVPNLELVTISVADDEDGLALLQRLSEARPELVIWGADTLFHGGERFADDEGRDRLRALRAEIESAFPPEMRD